MKKIIALIIVLLIIELEGLLACSVTPVDSAGVKTANGKKYIEYKVEEHEGWYTIARKYGISYSNIRLANKDVSDTIHIGQVILIPLDKMKLNDPGNQKNYVQHEDSLTGEPVFHLVKQKETFYAIAKKYHVTTDELKSWNHLQSGDLKKNKQIIVGYKKKGVKPAPVKGEEREQAAKPVLKETGELQQPANKDESFVTKSKPDSLHTFKTGGDHKITGDSTVVIKRTGVSTGRREVTEQGVATWIEDENINPNKYFALHRSASIGSIIKVTNRMNKRSIYVKVVGKLPDTGDNENIIIKISKASAEKLGVRDQRFQADLSYGVSEK